MTLNLTQRAARMSALVLRVSPSATRQQVADRLTEITGTRGDQWLGITTSPLPTDLHHRRAIAAGRVLTCTDAERSARTVEFFAADWKLPELDRIVPAPAEDHRVGVQMSLVS